MSRKRVFTTLTLIVATFALFAACTETGDDRGTSGEPSAGQQPPPTEHAATATDEAPPPEDAPTPTIAIQLPPTTTAQPTPTTAEEEWVEYASEEYNFSILLPDQPEENTMGSSDFSLSLEQETAYYAVNCSEMPRNTTELGDKDIRKILHEAGNGAINAINGTLTSERELTLNGYPGREVIAETSVGGMDATYTARIYLVDEWLFRTVVVVQADAAPEEDIQTFLDSFTLTTQAPKQDTTSESSDKTASWVTYTSAEYGFSVMMPEQPEEVVEAEGDVLVKVSRETDNYRVIYSPRPETLAEASTKEIQQFLVEAARDEVTSIEGATVSERDITLNGYPGREIVADVTVGTMDATYIARIYQVDNHIFRLIGLAEKGSEYAENIPTFLNSFALLEAGTTDTVDTTDTTTDTVDTTDTTTDTT